MRPYQRPYVHVCALSPVFFPLFGVPICGWHCQCCKWNGRGMFGPPPSHFYVIGEEVALGTRLSIWCYAMLVGMILKWRQSVGVFVYVFVSFYLHPSLSRYNNKVNKWVASRDQNTLSQGTWLLIFFCFQKLLDISIKFFLCLNIFGGVRKAIVS